MTQKWRTHFNFTFSIQYTVTDYKVTKNEEKDSLQETSEEKITS
jgi:hypothetical protein